MIRSCGTSARSALAQITPQSGALVLVVAAAAAAVLVDVAATSSSMSRTITTKARAKMTKAADAAEDVDAAVEGKAGTVGSGEMRIAWNLNVNLHGIGLRAAGRKTLVMMHFHITFILNLFMVMATRLVKVIINVVTLISRIAGMIKMEANVTMLHLSPAVHACGLLAGVLNFSGVDVYLFVLGVAELVVYPIAIHLLTNLYVKATCLH